MISRWSSPIPEIRVWPVSWSVRTRKVGSSSDRRQQAPCELVLVALRLRLDRDRDDRLGVSIDSSLIGAVSTASSRRVDVFFRPTSAAISPAPISALLAMVSACICRMRLIRSVRPVAVFSTLSPPWTRPE